MRSLSNPGTDPRPTTPDGDHVDPFVLLAKYVESAAGLVAPAGRFLHCVQIASRLGSTARTEASVEADLSLVVYHASRSHRPIHPQETQVSAIDSLRVRLGYLP